MQNNLKVLRMMRNLTQEDLASAIGISRQSMITVEADKYDCSVLTAIKLADFFGVMVHEIFFLPGEEMVYPNVNNQMPKRVAHEK